MGEGEPRTTSDEITDDLDVAVENDSERCLRLLLTFATSSRMQVVLLASSLLMTLASEFASDALRRWLFDRRVETMELPELNYDQRRRLNRADY
jgi:hypothetical protein